MARRDAMGKFLVLLIDNQGTKGCTRRITGRLPYTTSLVRTAYVLTRQMIIRLIEEETVVSDEGSVLAEAINKGDIKVLRKTWPNKTNLV